ncbi:MAG TPA: amidohydrolase/deacetylase family metallohydrolase [Candidatus Caccousia avicola]|uniref:Amidohydrolase/deacetylase family metallohydrolase n=1 Tax=Candidatus Caccousia avicola TaxID=2840721 RepID=A0A9D1AL46_9FIRM|nr:amidohydrolase/deacetylase family metallohydrolase [Candidatus Caccousia avicola]
MAAFDLLIRGGTVFDPEQCSFHQEDIAVRDGVIVRRDAGFSGEEAENILDASGCIVSPGLIDMHCHIYPVFPYVRRDSLRTTNAEEHMVRCGVTTAVDAGTCGWRNFGDFKENVIDATKLRVLAFLDIAAKGMAYPDSEQAVADINPQIAAAVAREWSDCIVGIKSAHYWPRHEDGEHPAFASIDGAREAAALCGKPVMVDSIPVVPERSYPAILSRLEPGDIHTHVFAQQFPLLNAQGKVEDYLRKERERGVRFDVGHGSGSFWFRQAVPCFEQDFWPDTISTDLHHQNVTGPAIDLLYVASKFLAMGMPLAQVLYRVTRAPALTLSRPELGTLADGACADLAVLRVREGRFGYLDCGGARLEGEGKLECVATVRAGEVLFDPEARSAPDWREAPPAYWTAPGLLRSWDLWNRKEEVHETER